MINLQILGQEMFGQVRKIQIRFRLDNLRYPGIEDINPPTHLARVLQLFPIIPNPMVAIQNKNPPKSMATSREYAPMVATPLELMVADEFPVVEVGQDIGIHHEESLIQPLHEALRPCGPQGWAPKE
jgi:hypothetical protein